MKDDHVHGLFTHRPNFDRQGIAGDAGDEYGEEGCSSQGQGAVRGHFVTPNDLISGAVFCIR
jgi:hypothetical protein